MNNPEPLDVGASASSTERRTAARSTFTGALMECRASLLAPDGESLEVQRRIMSTLAAAVHKLEVPPERFLATFKNIVLTVPTISRLPVDERMLAISRL